MTRLSASHVATAESSFFPVPSGILQRKCSCGTHTPGGGACGQCGSVGKHAGTKARRPESDMAEMPDKQAISTGRALDPAINATLAPLFGQDFSQVSIHDNAASYRAASALDARAFTIGQDVHFGAGEYQPASAEGQRLLAHELTHTVQQKGIASGGPQFAESRPLASNDALEAEADRAAEAVSAGRPVSVTGSAAGLAPQREDKGKSPPPPKEVAPRDPTAAEKKMIDAARRAAAIRTQIAGFKARGIQGAGPLAEARSLARTKFDWADPNMEQIGDILADMGGRLITIDVKVAGRGDPECGSRAGYVRGNRPPIVLCPPFFSSDAGDEGRIRTMVHEMAHGVGIGKATPDEQYFVVFDCDSKGAFESADSWSNYVHCLSGQTPDKPEEILGKPGGGKASPGTKK